MNKDQIMSIHGSTQHHVIRRSRYMTTEKSPEEINEENTQKMGQELGVLYSVLWQEVVSLHNRWNQFFYLFAELPARVEVLNETAPFFFREVQDGLFELIILHIARLTDPPKSGVKRNASIQGLAPLVSPELRTTLNDRVSSSLELCEFCRDIRNRRLAHCDLDLRINKMATPLPSPPCGQIQDALDSLASVIDCVSNHYTQSTTAFNHVPDGRGADALLHYLKAGIKMIDEQRHA